MIVNLNLVRVFYSASLGSMTLAAQELNVTPQAISKQLKTLEDIPELKLLYIEGRSSP